MPKWSVAVVVAGCLASAGGPARAEDRAGHPGVRPGEAFTYRFSVGAIEGARARMSIGAPATNDGHRLVAVQGHAETIALVALVAPVNDTYQLVLDADTLLPRELNTVERGMRERRFHTLFDGRAIDVDMTSATRKLHTKRSLAREVRDPLSAYFTLRAASLVNGQQLELDVLDGMNVWRAQLHVVGREQIRLSEDSPRPPAPVRAIHLEGTLTRIDDQARAIVKVAPRTISCWLSDDAARALLRASFDSELGRARLELTSYTPPQKKDPVRPAALPGVVIAAQ